MAAGSRADFSAAVRSPGGHERPAPPASEEQPVSLRLFASPAAYWQGPGAIDSLGPIVAGLADRAVAVVDAHVRTLLGGRIEAVLASAGISHRVLPFDGKVTAAAVDRLATAAGVGSGVVIAIGGGSAIDAGKAVANRLGRPVVTVPTAAANDAPTSRLVVLYEDDGAIAGVERSERNPAAVVVDTSVILTAPARLLVAGIGDALSKKAEAEGCAATFGLTPLGTRPLALPQAVAACAFETLLADAEAAVEDARAGRLSPAFERTVEAVVLMSGLGFESGGLSLAHSMTRGFTRLPACAGVMHGEQVAFALLVQLHATPGGEDDLGRLLPLYRRIGLPRSLAQVGLSAREVDALAILVDATLDAPHIGHLPAPVDRDGLMAAILAVDAIGRRSGEPFHSAAQ